VKFLFILVLLGVVLSLKKFVTKNLTVSTLLTETYLGKNKKINKKKGKIIDALL